MVILRNAIVQDAAMIMHHRHAMFAANQFASEERLSDMDEVFLPWVRDRLADGRYSGLLTEVDVVCMAGAGIFWATFLLTSYIWSHAGPTF